MAIDKLIKTVYNNGDGSPKNVETPDIQVGAWDMEQLVAKQNEIIDYLFPTLIPGIRIDSTNLAIWTLDTPISPTVIEMDFVLEDDVAQYQAFLGGIGSYQTMMQNTIGASDIFDAAGANASILIDGEPSGTPSGVNTPMPVGVTKTTLMDGLIHNIVITKATMNNTMNILGNNGGRPIEGIITRLVIDGDVYPINEGSGSTITSVGLATITVSAGTAEWVADALNP